MHSAPINTEAHWSALSSAEPDSAYRAWLSCLVSGLAQQQIVVDEAILLAMNQDSGDLQPVATWPGTSIGQDIVQLCEQAVAIGSTVCIQRERGLFAQPLLQDNQTQGLVALAFRAPVPSMLSAWIRWGQGWLSQYWQQAREQEQGDLREQLLLALDLTMLALEEKKSADAVHAVITEAAARLSCDRVSIGFGDKQDIKFFALSHSADTARRIDLVNVLEAAMNEALDQACAIRVGLFDSATNVSGAAHIPNWINIREHQRLVRDFGAEYVLSVPFSSLEGERSINGVFVFEWANVNVDIALIKQSEKIVPIIGRVLVDRRRAERPWVERFKDFLNTEWQRFVGPLEGKRKLFGIAGICIFLFFALVQGDHRLSAKASLEGAVRRVIVAPYDGFVAGSKARAGQLIKAGEEIASLDDRDMRLEASRWASQQVQYQKQTDDAQAQHNLSQIQIALAQARQASAQRELSESMVERSRILAPFDAFIVNGDLSQNLGGAVRKGQTLFELAPLDAYRVVLEVDEADIAYVAIGQTGNLMVTAMPGETFAFKVTLMTAVAAPSDGRNHFRVEASLLTPDDRLRPGMEGVAKVDVGQAHLVWIWTHRFFDWLRLQLWSWFGV